MIARTYISYATKDVKVAQTLCSALESRGIGCWISARDIQPGENFQVSKVRALREAKIMVLVFTHNSNTSEEMTRELALASQQKLIVIPLRVDDVTPGEAFAYEFATRQWIDVFADWESSIDQLCRRISLALEGVAAEPPTALKDDTAGAAKPAVAAASPPPAPVVLEKPAPVAKDIAPEPLRASGDDADIEVIEDGAGRPRVAKLALLAAGIAVVVGAVIAAPMLLQGRSRPEAPQVASGAEAAAGTIAPSTESGTLPLAAVALTETAGQPPRAAGNVAPSVESAALPVAAVAPTATPVRSARVKPSAPKAEPETDIPY